MRTDGVAALVESRAADRVAPETEASVLDDCLRHPTHRAQRVCRELRLARSEVSSSGVRGVSLRVNLQTRDKRLTRMKCESRDDTAALLTEEQVRCWSATARNQNIVYRGSLKAAGKVHVQRKTTAHSLPR